MSSKYSKNKEKRHRSKSKYIYHNYYLVPLIIVLSIIPLIVRQHIFSTHLAEYDWSSTNPTSADFFLYNKALSLIIVSSVIACILCYELSVKRKKIKFTRIFIPLGIYALLAFVSSIFSTYSYFSFHGIAEQFESIWVIIGYCLITYYAFLFINNEDDIKKIILWLTGSTTIMCLIGFSQVFSHDFYRSTIGKMLMLPSKYWTSLDDLSFNFDSGVVYMSLYNPNYVGVYVGLMAPIIISLIFLSKNKKIAFGYIALLLSLVLCLFGSQSRAGIVSLTISLLFMLVLYRKQALKQWKFILGGIALLFAGFILVNQLNQNILLHRISTMFHSEDGEKTISEIQTNDDNVTIVYRNEEFIIRMHKGQETSYKLTATDGSAQEIPCTVSDDGVTNTVNDERFPGFQFSLVNFTDYYGFLVKIDNRNWYFTNQTDGTYYYWNAYGKLDKINSVKSSLLANNKSFASGRGYIWSTTIPLLSDYLFLGSGADTFAFVYPQDDYVGMTNYGFAGKTMTKPHSMYLQTGIQTGMLSLISFLTFYGMYFFSSLMLCWKSKLDSYMAQIGASILVGTLSYMIAGLTNDSTITVAPLFYALIGIGLAINYKLKSVH